MTNINTILKNRKNKKGFSLIELIVVLVIMAILAAALVPSLIGYINQSRNNTAINEAASCVSAAQTIASSAYADPNGEYHDQNTSTSFSPYSSSSEGEFVGEAIDATEELAEVDADSISKVTVEKGVVKELQYTTSNGVKVKYDGSTYKVVDKFDATALA